MRIYAIFDRSAGVWLYYRYNKLCWTSRLQTHCIFETRNGALKGMGKAIFDLYSRHLEAQEAGQQDWGYPVGYDRIDLVLRTVYLQIAQIHEGEYGPIRQGPQDPFDRGIEGDLGGVQQVSAPPSGDEGMSWISPQWGGGTAGPVTVSTDYGGRAESDAERGQIRIDDAG